MKKRTIDSLMIQTNRFVSSVDHGNCNEIPNDLLAIAASLKNFASALLLTILVVIGVLPSFSLAQTTTTTVIDLGAFESGGTAFDGEAPVQHIALNSLPPGSFLRSISFNYRIESGDPFVGSLAAFFASSQNADGRLLIVGEVNDGGYNNSQATVTWDAGGGIDVGTTASATVFGLPAIDLHDYAMFLDTGYPGSWSGTVTVEYDVPVLSVSLQSPSNNQVVLSGNPLNVSASVIDPGNLSNTVTFTVTPTNPAGAPIQIVSTSTSSPFLATFTGLPEGAYELVASTFNTASDSATTTRNFSVFTPLPGSYNYVRFTPIKLRDGVTANSIQIAEMEFFNGTQKVSFAGATISNPGGSNPPAQSPGQIADDNLITKWLDFNRQPIVFQFPVLTAINRYRFATAEDAIERDPVSWKLEGSLDGITWFLLDERNDDPISFDRQIFTQQYLITPFELVSLFPVDNSNFNGTSDLILTFNRPVALGTGNIRIKNLTDNNQIVIPINDPQISVSGNVVTINPTDDLILNKNYAIEIDATAITSVDIYTFSGVSDNVTWNFTIGDALPTIIVITPTTPSAYGDNVTFTATITPNPASGTVAFFNGGNQIGAAANVNSAGVATITTNFLTLGAIDIKAEFNGVEGFLVSESLPISHLVNRASLTVQPNVGNRLLNQENPVFSFSITGFKNNENAASAGIVGAPAMNTEATAASPIGSYLIAPDVRGMSADNYDFVGADGVLNVVEALASFTRYRFVPTVLRGNTTANSIQLAEFEFAFNSSVVDVSSASGVTVSNPGGNNPGAQTVTNIRDSNISTKWLDFNRQPVIFQFATPTTIDRYRFITAEDASERDPVSWRIEGSNDGITWVVLDVRTSESISFTRNQASPTYVIPSPPLVVTAYNPADNGTIFTSADLTLTFDRPIAKGTGNITIKNTSDTTQAVIDVSDPQVSVSGSTMTINLTSDLLNGKNYAVQIEAGAIVSQAGASFGGISGDTTWNFFARAPFVLPTAPPVTAGMVLWLPADGVDDVDTTNQVRISGSDTFVTRWTDRTSSSASNHASNTTTSTQPRYIANGLNGRPVIRFSGNTSLTTANLASQFPRAATAFIVTTINDNEYNLLKTGPSANDEWWRWSGDGTSYPGFFRTTRITSYAPMPTSGTHLFAVTSSSSSWEMWQNGTSLGASTASYNAGGTIVIGNGTSRALNGDIAEVIFYNRVLTATEYNQVGAYLTQKYALTTSYPSTFGNWIASPSFNIPAESRGFAFDADSDSVPNGVEAWLGSNPSQRGAGIVATGLTGTVFRFTHPQGTPATSNVTGAYQWSTNMSDWYAPGTQGTTTVSITPSLNTPSVGTTTVQVNTVGSTIAPTTLFIRIVASQN